MFCTYSEKMSNLPCNTSNLIIDETTTAEGLSASGAVVSSRVEITEATSNTSATTTTAEENEVDITLFEKQNDYNIAQEEVKKARDEKIKAELNLITKRDNLKRAQEEYNMALLEDSSAEKLVQEANAKLSSVDLQMPGQWNTMYHKLVEFKKRHGHCNVAQDRSLRKRDMQDEDNDRKALGRWVGNQRVFHKYYLNGDKRYIKPHRIDALNKLGFVWDVKEQRWIEKYQDLLEYKRLHGHFGVTWKEDKGLCEWVRRQRYQYHRMQGKESTTLTQERINKLYSIGFQFDSTLHDRNKV